MPKIVLYIPLVLSKYCDCCYRSPRIVYFGVQDLRWWDSSNKFLLSTYCSAGYEIALGISIEQVRLSLPSKNL